MGMEPLFPGPDVQGEFTISKPGIEFLLRWEAGGPGRERGKVVWVQTYPNNGWGRDEGMPIYRKVQVPHADIADVKRGWTLDVSKLPEQLLNLLKSREVVIIPKGHLQWLTS